MVVVFVLCLVGSACAAQTQTWDPFVYFWTRVYTSPGVQDTYNCASDDFNVGNPVEVFPEDGQQAEDMDRFRLTLDGLQLSVNRPFIQTAGGSSSATFDLVLADGWAVCGSVFGGGFVPDPYATFVGSDAGSGYITWAANTPVGYTTSLLLGVGDSMSIRKHPTYGGSPTWEQSLAIAPHSFDISKTGAMVPECPPICSLSAFLSSGFWMLRRRIRKQ